MTRSENPKVELKRKFFWLSRNQLESGFSLVEILVSLLIVVILALLIYPNFSKISGKVDAAGCVSKLKALYVGLSGYAADHNGYMPAVEDVPKGSLTWLGCLRADRYLEINTKSRNPLSDVAYCPGSKVRDSSGRADMIYANYGMNTHVGGRIRVPANRSLEPKPVQSFAQPSRTLLVADAGFYMLYPTVLDAPGPPSLYFPGASANASATWDDRFRNDAIVGRHGGIINALMLDGHVKSIPANKLQVSDFWEDL